jgi:hypothetical protein
LNFRDRQDAANLGCGEVHFVAGVQVFGRDAVLYLVLVEEGRCAGCANRSGWRMLKSNLTIDMIKLGDPARVLIFLGQSPQLMMVMAAALAKLIFASVMMTSKFWWRATTWQFNPAV